MKVCFPVKSNEGLESVPYNHFGSAPLFLVFDTENNEITSISNGDLNHEHGLCQPIKALSGTSVNAIVVGGIGQGAISKLNAMGIKVFRANSGNLSQNLDLFKTGQLKELDLASACTDHSCH